MLVGKMVTRQIDRPEFTRVKVSKAIGLWRAGSVLAWPRDLVRMRPYQHLDLGKSVGHNLALLPGLRCHAAAGDALGAQGS